MARVLIGTTEGPSEVQRLAQEDPSVGSVVCLDGSTEALPISRAYDAFVRAPTGVVERMVGHPVFRVDVSRRIDEGRSWQLGLLLAHRLAATGRLAQGDPAPTTIWATGEVSHAMSVLSVDHVERKIRRSADLLAARVTAGDRVVVLMPSADAHDLNGAILPEGVELLAVDRVEQAFAAIEHAGILGPPVPVRPRSMTARSLGLGLLIAGAATALVIVGLSLGVPWRTDEAPANGPDLPVVVDPEASLSPPSAIAPSSTVPPPSIAAMPPLDRGSVSDAESMPDDAVPPLPGRRPAVASSKGPVAAVSPPVAILGKAVDGSACGAVGPPAPKAPALNLPRACRVVAIFTNSDEVPVDAVLELRLEGGFADYVRADRFHAEARETVAPGRSISVSIAPPDWVRRSFAARATASFDGRVERVKRQVDLR